MGRWECASVVMGNSCSHLFCTFNGNQPTPMLRFFRKIRQRLIEDARFSKYLLYAIGEILLVVIGILIALQANNWNEQNKNAEEVHTALRALHNEIEINIAYLESRVDRIDAYLDRTETYIGILSTPEPEAVPDSVLLQLVSNVGPLSFIPLRRNAFSNLMGSGAINRILDDSLKLELLSLERGYQVFNDKQTLLEVSWEQNLKPYYINYHDLIGVDGDTLHKNPIPDRQFTVQRDAFINNRRFTNMLTQRIWAGENTQGDFERIAGYMETINAHVAAYLEEYGGEGED